MRPLPPLALCLALAAPAAAQQTIIVDAQNRPGTHYTTIQAGIQAAFDGDIVRVRDGVYPVGVGIYILNKGVHVFADPGAVLDILSVFGGFIIQHGGTKKSVVIDGFATRRWGMSISIGPAARGQVLISNLDLSQSFPQAKAQISMVDADHVSIVNVQGSVAIGATRSNVSIRDSTIDGTQSVALFAGPGMGLGASYVDLSNTTVIGVSNNTFGAGSGISMDAASTLVLRGDGQTRVVAGTSPGFGPVSAISGEGTVIADGNVVLVPGTGAPSVEPGVTFTPTSLPRLSAPCTPPGQQLTVDLQGTPGDVFALAAGFPVALATTPAVRGAIWASPLLQAATGTIPASGSFQLSITLPSNPTFHFDQVTWQGFVLAATGLEATNPATICFPF